MTDEPRNTDWPAALKPEVEALETAAGDADYVAWAAACAALVEKVRRLMARAHAHGLHADGRLSATQEYDWVTADALLSEEQDQ